MARMHNLIVEYSKILVSQEVNVANPTPIDILSLITYMHANVFLNMIWHKNRSRFTALLSSDRTSNFSGKFQVTASTNKSIKSEK